MKISQPLFASINKQTLNTLTQEVKETLATQQTKPVLQSTTLQHILLRSKSNRYTRNSFDFAGNLY